MKNTIAIVLSIHSPPWAQVLLETADNNDKRGFCKLNERPGPIGVEMDFSWKEEYRIGLDEIDAQHRQLLWHIQQLSEAALANANAEVLGRCVDELGRYFEFHLGSEELLMRCCEYPGMGPQLAGHEALRVGLRQRAQSVLKGEAKSHDLVMFLVRWFVSHTTSLDRELGAFVLNQREAASLSPSLARTSVVTSLSPE
jgi:hemerythrin